MRIQLVLGAKDGGSYPVEVRCVTSGGETVVLGWVTSSGGPCLFRPGRQPQDVELPRIEQHALDALAPALKPPEVVHVSQGYDVLIDRTTKWGNPFEIGRDGTRGQVIDRYRSYITGRDDLLNDLYQLRGLRLGCHCKPEPCHGDVLASLVNERFPPVQARDSQDCSRCNRDLRYCHCGR